MPEWTTLKSREGVLSSARTGGALFLWLLSGALLARANMFGLYPFGAAYLLGMFFLEKKKAWPGLLGVVLSLFFIKDGMLAAQIGMIFLLGFPAALKLSPRRKGPLLLLTAILCTLVPWGTSYLLGVWNDEWILFGVLQGVLGASFLFIFLYVMDHRKEIGKGLLRSEQGMAVMLLVSLALSGLHGVSFGKVDMQIVVVVFVVLYISGRFGPGIGAGAGAMLGFMLQWNVGVENLVAAGMYSLMGFLCGAFQRFEKVGIALAFAAYALMMVYFISGEEALHAQLYSYGLGLALFLLFPQGKSGKTTFINKVMPEIETSASKIRAVSALFEELSHDTKKDKDGDWEPALELSGLIDLLAEHVCGFCPEKSRCWENHYYHTYHYMEDVLAALEQNKGQEALSGYCPRGRELILGAKLLLEREAERETWQKQKAQEKEMLAGQYHEIAEVVNHLARELYASHNYENGRVLTWPRAYKNLLDVGVGSFIKTGNAISGDNYCALPVSSMERMFLLCDGMGVGEEAAKMSATALSVLERLLSTGFEPERAVKTLNALLTVKFTGEAFVTLDAVLFQLNENRVRLWKIGAPPTYVLHGKKVKLYQKPGLPVGIFQEIEVQAISIPFLDETVVMVTDGILDAVKRDDGEDWLEDFLANRGQEADCAQGLADLIIERAVEASDGSMGDDGVVLVIRRNSK